MASSDHDPGRNWRRGKLGRDRAQPISKSRIRSSGRSGDSENVIPAALQTHENPPTCSTKSTEGRKIFTSVEATAIVIVLHMGTYPKENCNRARKNLLLAHAPCPCGAAVETALVEEGQGEAGRAYLAGWVQGNRDYLHRLGGSALHGPPVPAQEGEPQRYSSKVPRRGPVLAAFGLVQ
jgi:hypothetical protein